MTLEIEDLHVYYGESHIIQGMSMRVEKGETVALLGRNGAGKTTTMRAVSGFVRCAAGRVRLDGRDITRTAAHRRSRLGLSFVPSGRRAFDTLTVRQNLAVASRAWRMPKRDWDVNRVMRTFPQLADLADRRAGFLSGGEQQMLKLARGLLGNPQMLLLDEPTEGLSPAVVKDLGRWLDLIRGEGLTVFITEQNALFALAHADRGYVMEKGQIRYASDSDSLRDSSEIRSYLGVARTG